MKVWVTGGHGFLGRHVYQELQSRGHEVLAPMRVELMDKEAIQGYLIVERPQAIVHLAALCGGIQANRLRPAEFFYQNLMMGTMLMHEAWCENVSKFVGVGTVCSYPKFTPVPFKESDLWNGYPEETNAPYGLAKKMVLVQGRAYRMQYGFNAVYVIPVNLYGPGDDFDPKSSHVIPALIRKVDEAMQAGLPQVSVWGTGHAGREFLYVEDAAKGICDALDTYNGSDPINLGTGKGITIRKLARKIGQLMGYEGEFHWDPAQPVGQPTRRMDVGRAKNYLGWEAEVDLDEGLKRTIAWWREHGKD